MSASEDTALIAGQLADLTRKVDEMAEQLKGLRGDADDAQLRSDTQQERIDLAARELA
jgi:outer membrane murein-binding lipoprotein Lpp